MRRRLFTPAAGTSAGRTAAQASLRPRAESADRFRCQSYFPEFFSFVGHGDHCRTRGEKVSEVDGVPVGGSAFFARAEEKLIFWKPSSPRARLSRPRGGRTAALHDALRGVVSFPPEQEGHNELPMFLQRLSGFRRAGNTNPARWTGGPVSARSRKDARRACFSVLRACVPA